MPADLEPLRRRVGALLSQGPEALTPDAELLGRFARARDEAAFAALVARYGPMVLAACRRAARDAALAEDAAQATFLVLARQAAAIRRPEALAAWLHQTARNLALKHARAESRRRRGEAGRPAPPAPPGPLDELTLREAQAIFDEELARLPERYRLPLLLCALEGCTLEEAGRRLGWSAGSVKGRLERGRARLHQRLARRGLALAAGLLAGGLGHPAASAAFVRAAVEAVGRFVQGSAVGAAAALAEESLRGATMIKVRVALAVVLAAGLLSAAVGHQARPSGAGMLVRAVGPPPAPRLDRHGDPLPAGAVARLGTLRWRAAGEVHTVALAPDGKHVATASSSGLCLLDGGGKLVTHLAPRRTDFQRLAFSPDGKQLAAQAVAQGKMVVHVYDAPAGRLVKEVEADGLEWLGWSADGKLLGALRAQGAILYRELLTGKEQRLVEANLPPPSWGLYARAVAPAAGVLAAPDPKGVIHVWSTATGKKLWALKPKGTRAFALALAPDGRRLASLAREGQADTAELWDLTTGQAARTPPPEQKHANDLIYSPDGKTLVTLGSYEVRLWDAATGKARARLEGAASFAPSASFSRDGKTLATVESHSGSVHLWDATTGAHKLPPAGHTNRVSSAAFSPDGRRAVTAGSMDGTLIVWDATTGRALTRLRRGEWARNVVFTPDGGSMFSSWTTDKVYCDDAATGRELFVLSLGDPQRPKSKESGYGLVLSDDGRALVSFSHSYPAGAGAHEGMVIVGFDVATRKPTFRRRVADTGYAVSADAKVWARAKEDRGRTHGQGPVRVEDVKTGAARLSLPAPADKQTYPLAFSPDGRLLATVTSRAGGALPGGGGPGRDYAVRVWELASGGEVLALPSNGVNSQVAFTADGAALAVPSGLKQLQVWDLRRGEERARLTGVDGVISCLAFSPDGRRLISGFDNSTALVWDVARPKRQGAALDARALAKAWAELAGEPKAAFAARGRLALSPADAVPFLAARLRPVKAADAAEVKRLIAGLDSDVFATREKARRGLEALGDAAAAGLRKALEGKPSVEAYRRIEALLRRQGWPVADAEALRALRGVAVLEDVGDGGSRKLLEALAGGAAGARLTEEAKAALARLGRRR